MIIFNQWLHKLFDFITFFRCDDISNLWKTLFKQLEERRKRLEVAAGLFKVFEEMKTILLGLEEIKVHVCNAYLFGSLIKHMYIQVLSALLFLVCIFHRKGFSIDFNVYTLQFGMVLPIRYIVLVSLHSCSVKISWNKSCCTITIFNNILSICT